jgi:hypothetical protein
MGLALRNIFILLYEPIEANYYITKISIFSGPRISVPINILIFNSGIK